jgi:hypothetical protein
MAGSSTEQEQVNNFGNLVLANKMKFATILFVAVTGTISIGWLWSVLRISNEIKWVSQNKPYVCTVLANRQASLYDYQKKLLKDTYNNSTTTAINQVFLGASMTTLAVERQTVNASQLHYGCAMPIFKSNLE